MVCWRRSSPRRRGSAGQPTPQQAAAHRRRAAVQVPGPCTSRPPKLVRSRGCYALRVENHGLLAPLAAQRAQCGRAPRCCSPLEQAAAAPTPAGALGVEARQIERAELLAEQALAGAGIEVPRRPTDERPPNRRATPARPHPRRARLSGLRRSISACSASRSASSVTLKRRPQDRARKPIRGVNVTAARSRVSAVEEGGVQ